MSMFHGLEMAKQALFTQRSALYTTSHNIYNANTDGYSRQRVTLNTLPPFPSPSKNRPQIPGQMGTGVEAGLVQRVRNQYLDKQFRSENSKTGYWEAKSDALHRMENLLNEPSDSGLSKTMNLFWNSLQDVAANAENLGARSVAVQRGQAVSDTFNYISDSLKSIRADLKGEIDHVVVKDVNSIVQQISKLNEQISRVEPHGLLPNDIYDDRDRLVDELSDILNIKVSYSRSSKSAKDVADGLVSIELVDDEGHSLVPSVRLVNGDLTRGDLSFKQMNVEYGTGPKHAAKEIQVGNVSPTGKFVADQSFSIDDFKSSGSLIGTIESYGYIDNSGNVVGEYPEKLQQFDDMALAFATEFNNVHNAGTDMHGNAGKDFFIIQGTDTAGTLKIDSDFLDDAKLIAASLDGSKGNGDNASDLADVFDTDLAIGSETASTRNYYQSMIGELGVHAQEANRMKANSNILLDQVKQQRESVSSVSLDEEMTNMIKFQHAYSAAARSMTAVDEMINRVINNMGLVGR